MVSRREFLKSAALLPAAFATQRSAPLAERFSDLRRHFVFEYYPWFAGATLVLLLTAHLLERTRWRVVP